MPSPSRAKIAALVPEYWNIVVGSPDDVIFLGKVTIRGMIRAWRYEATGLAKQIKDRDELLTFLHNKNAGEIASAAQQHENPTFTQIGTLDGAWGREPEPLDEASKVRKSGATTFNVCGWCKYAGSGLCRYDYHIASKCSIRTYAGLEDEERRFDSACFLPTASDNVFNDIRTGLARERTRLIATKRTVDGKIKTLLSLEKRSQKKPAMPAHRPHDWFDVGDELVCYVAEWADKITSCAFATAKVIDGYRHHDGCVSVRYDERIHAGEYLDGHGGGYGMARPEVMHKWEYEYLVRHATFASVFAGQGTDKRLEHFQPKRFVAALSSQKGGT